MTRYFAHLVMLAALTAGAAGCSTVRVAQPVGDASAALDPGAWNGTWCDPSSLVPPDVSPPDADAEPYCVALTVVDPSQGVVEAVFDSDPEKAVRAHLRRIGAPENTASDGGPLYVTVEDEKGLAFVMRVVMSDNVLISWDVDARAFQRALGSGLVRGEMTGDDTVVLDGTDPATLRHIAEHDEALFRWKTPSILVRCSRR